MTYGKANRPSRYLRTHPYRKEPCGSPRPDEEVTIGDVWDALGTVTKYVVNSVYYIVQKFTGMGTKPVVKDESTEKLESINGDALSISSSSFYNPNFDRAEGLSTRQQSGFGEINPRRRMWLPPHQRPTPQHQYYPYIADRRQGLSFRSLNQRRNTMMSCLSPRTVNPSPYRRPWSSAITPKAPISRLSNWRPRRANDSAYNQRPYFSRDIDDKSSRRKLFSWEKSGSNLQSKHEDGSRNEGKILTIFTDSNNRRESDQTEQTLVRGTEAKNGMNPKPSFAARLNRSASKDNYGKRKTFMGYDRRLNFKRHKGLAVTPEKSGMDITGSRCNDVGDVLWKRSQSNSDVSMEEEGNASLSDKIVGNIEVNEAPKVLSSKNIPISLSKSVQSNGLSVNMSDSNKPASNSIFSLDATKNSGLCEDVVSEKTLKPTSSSTGMLGLSEKDGLEISSSTDVFSQSVKNISETNIPVSSVKAKLVEDTAKPKAESAKPLERDTKLNSNKMATIIQKPSKPLAEENISFACRMTEMKRIKIRYHYVQKIESLYDSNCNDKDKEAKKSKALSMYRDKYHKLQQDHLFYTKLCKQYNVEPGEEYIGVDPDIKHDNDEEINNKKTVSEPFSFKPNLDVAPWGDSKSKVDPKPASDKPHINPFAVDTIKPDDKRSKKGFNFSGNIFTTNSEKAPKRKLEDSSSTNLFTSPKSSNMFSGQSITASSATNPFSPSGTAAASSPLSSVFKSNSGNAKNNLFNSTDGVFKPAGGLFGSTRRNGAGVVSMDSDVPSGNNTFNSSNPFASKGQKRNINLFPSITNANNAFSMQQGGSSGTGPFGNVKNNANLFTTSSSRKRGFGSSGVFNPGNMGRGDAPVFSLGKVSGQAGKKKRRSIVRGRRTLSK